MAQAVITIYSSIIFLFNIIIINNLRLTNGGYTTTPFSNQKNSDINFANTLRSYDRMAPI